MPPQKNNKKLPNQTNHQPAPRATLMGLLEDTSVTRSMMLGGWWVPTCSQASQLGAEMQRWQSLEQSQKMNPKFGSLGSCDECGRQEISDQDGLFLLLDDPEGVTVV